MQLKALGKSKKIVPLTLVVSMYKELQLLEFFFHSLSFQTRLPAEIIISEDGDSDEARTVVNKLRARYPALPSVKHLQQADLGFRKTTALNEAVLHATHEQIVFMDVDCFPHRKFLEEAAALFQPNTFLIARPVLLRRNHYAKLVAEHRVVPSLWELIGQKARPLECGIHLSWRRPRVAMNRSVLGSGWSCGRSSLIAINGFEERFNEGGYGFEDTDVGNRLKRAGVVPLLVKNRLVFFHNGQGEEARTEQKNRGVEINSQILDENDRQQRIQAVVGLSKRERTDG